MGDPNAQRETVHLNNSTISKAFLITNKKLDKYMKPLLLVLLFLLSSCSNNGDSNLPTPPKTGSHIMSMTDAEIAADYLAQKFGSENVLIAYDIDNTLMAMNQTLGSDQWFTWQSSMNTEVQWFPNFGCALTAQGILYRLGDMRLTNENVDDTVRSLQSKGHPSIAITSRGPQFRMVTFRELRRNGLDFSEYSIPDSSNSKIEYIPYSTETLDAFSKDEITEYKLMLSDDRPRSVIYEDGVYFTAGQHKGAMLRLLLTNKQYMNKIKAVVFIDDSYEKHVLGMMMALDNVGIEHFAYGYDAEKEIVDKFNNNVELKKEVGREWCDLAVTLPVINKLYGDTQFPISITKNDENIINCLVKTSSICP